MVKSSHFPKALAVSLSCLGASFAMAQSTALAPIDQDLLNNIDFRTLDFSVCLGQESCTVNGVTLMAQRLNELDDDWHAAEIYWDPIDGVAVKEGEQNDEIDFDERLQVSFEKPVKIQRVWLSDLFRQEDGRYGSTETDVVQGVPQDVETAGISLVIDEVDVFTFSAWGENLLPDDSFDLLVSPRFTENGNLRQRVVINDETVTLVVPDVGAIGGTLRLRLPIGQIDKEKLALFEGLETSDIDLKSLLREFHNAPVFAHGSHNLDLIESLLNDPGTLEEFRQQAGRSRLRGDLSNGEQAVELPEFNELDGLKFFAPFDASNDYSIAGLVLAN